MKIINAAFMALLVAMLSGCIDDELRVPRQRGFVPHNQNPIIAYCGPNCGGCHQSESECLKLLEENLPTLCDNTKGNCYDVWVQYSARCRQFCPGR